MNAAECDGTESGKNGRTLNPTEKTIMTIGGRAAGGIAGSTFCTVVEDCMSCGQILLSSGTSPVQGYADLSTKTDKDQTAFVGGICGLTMHSRENEEATFEEEHFINCAYTGSFTSAVCPLFLSEDSEIIAGNRQITEQEAEAMAMELLK